MDKKEALKIFKETNTKLDAYRQLINLAAFDKDTIAPKKGKGERNEALTIMCGEVFSIETDKKYVEAVEYLLKKDLPLDTKREVELVYKSLEQTLKFSKEESMAFSALQMESMDAWVNGREKDDYKLFEPNLLKIIEVLKERLNRINPKKQPYEVLLDTYQEASTLKMYDNFFNKIKEDLLPLIKEVSKKEEMIDDSFLHLYYPIDKQKEFSKELLKYLNFNKGWSMLSETEHPYTTEISENDCRITTHYYENDIASSIFSIIHEAGHAYYDHQVAHKYQKGSLKSGISMGMHESQSRFNENYLAKRKSFWVKLYPKLQKLFPENLKDITLDQFVLAINKSVPSFIRTEADELTYPIHVLIRYEIEKGIFDGSIDTSKLSEIWNQKYKEYLGLEVKKDSQGILQDIHWSDGSFGYFPTYALGSAIGAQLLKKMEKELDIDQLLIDNKYSVIQKWLKDKVQQYGALYTYDEILKMVTGKKFSADYYTKYLTNKYKKLYQI
ncbi:MAG: carboxypeptidase M32 [Erysipelotrichaceae bacterium]|nr:carboxypeptidase M32 [Erysipelotrichaceae bacterium]